MEALVAMARTRVSIHSRLPFGITVWTNLGSGAGAADHCGWPVLADRVDDVKAWLRHKAGTGPLLLRSMSPSMARLVPVGGKRVGVTPCPRLTIPADRELIGNSAKFRKSIRYNRRRLADAGVGFRWIPPEQMDRKLLRSLLDLHSERRALKGDETTFGYERENFHLTLLEASQAGRGPAAAVAELDGEVVGIIYGFLWGNVFSYYQSGWSPRFAPLSLGTVLTAEAIALAGQAGASVFDFLRGAENYKYRFAAGEMVDETWLLPSGPSGRILLLKYLAKRS